MIFDLLISEKFCHHHYLIKLSTAAYDKFSQITITFGRLSYPKNKQGSIFWRCSRDS